MYDEPHIIHINGLIFTSPRAKCNRIQWVKGSWSLTSSLLQGLTHKTIIRKCSEDNAVCVPVERYCDRVADCPEGSDEGECSCEDWGMQECSIDGSNMCIFRQWIGNKSIDSLSDDSCENIARQQKIIKKQTNNNRLDDNMTTAASYKDVLSSNKSLKNLTLLYPSTIYSSVHTILINDVYINNVNITLSNVGIQFVNCKLHNVLIQEEPSVKQKLPTHLQMILMHSSLQCDRRLYGLRLTSFSVVKLYINNTTIDNCQFNVVGYNIMLIIKRSILTECSIKMTSTPLLNMRVPSIVNLFQTIFIAVKVNWLNEKNIFAMHNSYIIIDGCTFSGIPVEINQPNVPIRQEIYYLEITQSAFENASKNGNGGAISISSDVEYSTVKLIQNTFQRNKARKKSGATPGKGGAVHIGGSSLFVAMNNCVFDQNVADDQGSSLYITEGVTVEINDSSFLMELSKYESYPIASVYGKVTRLTGKFEIIQKYPNKYDLRLKIFSSEENFGDLNILVKCPLWHQHVVHYQIASSGGLTGMSSKSIRVINNFLYECRVCSEGYYVASYQTNAINYSVNLSTSDKAAGMPGCILCPYGATCPGNNVLPKPNFWGYWQGGELVFQQCPALYCCSGGQNAPCEKYNSCAGNRTGILCGACKNGFSVSILTGECMPDIKCEQDRWFWILGLLATVLYAIWYTFKYDVILLIFHTIICLKHWFFTVLKLRRQNSFSMIWHPCMVPQRK